MERPSRGTVYSAKMGGLIRAIHHITEKCLTQADHIDVEALALRTQSLVDLALSAHRLSQHLLQNTDFQDVDARSW